MLDPDQHMASVVRKAGQEDLANAIQGHPTFRCDIAVTSAQRCSELAQIHQRQQIMSDRLALALALMVAAIVGQVAVSFVGAIGARLQRMRPNKGPDRSGIAPQGGALSDG